MFVFLLTVIITCVLGSSEDGKVDKRLLMNDNQYVQSSFLELERKVQELQEKLDSVVNTANTSGPGATYVRWGKKSCPVSSTAVYSGYPAGKGLGETGSGANILCLSDTPKWDYYKDGVQTARGYIYGAEYEPDDGNHANLVHNLIPDIDNDQNTPCTVCQMPSHRNVLMVPGTNTCYPGWTLEYKGHLMSADATEKGPTEYICVDATADYIPGGKNSNQHLLFPVEGRCGTLPCPPFVEGRELTCAVCSN